jgi:hypothetical protein
MKIKNKNEQENRFRFVAEQCLAGAKTPISSFTRYGILAQLNQTKL